MPLGLFHGMTLRACLEPSVFGATIEEMVVPVPLRATDVFLAGTRHFDPPERQYMLEKGMAYRTPTILTRVHGNNGGSSSGGASAKLVSYNGGKQQTEGGVLSSETLQHIHVVQQWRGLGLPAGAAP